MENEVFEEAKQELLERYGEEIFGQEFIHRIAPPKARRFISSLNLSVENRVRDFNDKLYALICIRLKWCERREHPMIENAELAAGIVDIFGTNGAAALTVLLLKRKFLDKLCNCKARIQW